MNGRGSIRVLMVGPDRSVHGGISGVVNNYYEAGLDEKIQLCYIGTMVEGSKLRKLGKAMCAFGRFCLRLPGYQIVHVNVASDSSYYRKAFFIRAAGLFGKKIVIHQHGGDFENFYHNQLSDRGRKNVRKVLGMADVFLVLAPVWKSFFGQIIPEERIVVLPDSIRIPEAVKKQYGQHQLLFLGRLCREKGIGELLTAVEALQESCPDIHLYLGGIWEDEKLRELAAGNSKHVTWLGWITGAEKIKYLTQCDIFVLPSYFEGQSVSLLEAMAYSCGIVASKTGGIPQMIREGETGLFVTPKDSASLRQGIEQLIKDDELCRSLGEKARKKVSAEFSIEKNMEELLEIYGKLI